MSVALLADREAIAARKIYSAHPGQYDASTGQTLLLCAGTAATLLAHIQGELIAGVPPRKGLGVAHGFRCV